MSSKRTSQFQNPPVVSSISIEAPAVLVQIQPLALSVADAARAVGAPEYTLHEHIKAGRLSAKKAGRSHVILIPELQKWLASLDPANMA
jgi:hypothetical protein